MKNTILISFALVFIGACSATPFAGKGVPLSKPSTTEQPKAEPDNNVTNNGDDAVGDSQTPVNELPGGPVPPVQPPVPPVKPFVQPVQPSVPPPPVVCSNVLFKPVGGYGGSCFQQSSCTMNSSYAHAKAIVPVQAKKIRLTFVSASADMGSCAQYEGTMWLNQQMTASNSYCPMGQTCNMPDCTGSSCWAVIRCSAPQPAQLPGGDSGQVHLSFSGEIRLSFELPSGSVCPN